MWFTLVIIGLHPNTADGEKALAAEETTFDRMDRSRPQNIKESDLQPKFQFHCFSDVSWQGKSEVGFVPNKKKRCQNSEPVKPSDLSCHFMSYSRK